MTNPTQFTWTVPTTNVDGTPIAAGEVIGYAVGLRDVSASTPGVYSRQVSVLNPTATSVAVPTDLADGTYAAAVLAIGTPNSAYSPEITFSYAQPVVVPPVPNAPTNLAVA